MRCWKGTLAGLLALLGCGDDQTVPPAPPPSSTSLVVRVTEGGRVVPAKLLLYDPQGTLVRIGTLDFALGNGRFQDRGYCALAQGAIGTWEGIALGRGEAELPVGVAACDDTVAIPYGRYRARVARGAEFEFFEADVDLSERRGRVVLEAQLERAFSPGNMVSADLHVHAQGSGDSTLPRDIRVITEAAAGIQVIASSDHNLNADFRDEIDALGMRGQIASLPGNEVSIDLGHFNVFPVVVDPSMPRGGSLGDTPQIGRWSARRLFDEVRALPGNPLLQVNHARLGFAAYFDIAGWDGTSWPPPMPIDFDVLEVLTGWTSFNKPGDRRLDRAVGDFYTMAKNGRFVTALGNSDTHHLNSILAGFPRSYIRLQDKRLDPFDESGFLEALRQRRAVATTGPWLDVDVEGAQTGGTARAVAGHVGIQVHVRQASFVHATRLRVWVGGELREDVPMPGGRVFDWTGTATVGPADTWIGVDVSGEERLPPELVGDYHSMHGGMQPFALINPILVDADGDGQISIPQMAAAQMRSLDLAAPKRVPGAAWGPYDCGEMPR